MVPAPQWVPVAVTSSSRTRSPDGPIKRRRWLRPMLLAGVWVAATLALLGSSTTDIAVLRSHVAAAGPAAPLLFVVVFALATLAPLPKNALSAGAGLLFGFSTAVAAVWVGALLGATAAFWLARSLGRDAVTRLAGDRVRRADDMLARRGMLGVLIARLVPVLPFTVINYGSGLAAVPFTSYASATAVGILPGTIAYVALGAYSGTRG